MRCFLTVLKSVALVLGIFAGLGSLIVSILVLSLKTVALLGLPEPAVGGAMIGYMSVVLGVFLGVIQCAAERRKQ